MKKLFGILALVGLSLTACKKDEDDNNPFAGNWKGVTADFYTDGQYDGSLPMDDNYITLDDCKINTGEYCTGRIKTSPTDAGSSIKYKVSDNSTSFVMDEDGNLATTDDRTEAKVEKITATEFHISQEQEEVDVDSNGNPYTYTVKTILKMTKI